MNDKIMIFLNNQVNINNSIKHVNDLLHDASRYYDTGIKSDIDDSITVENYIQFAYIDLLINDQKAPKDLKDIFNKYLILNKKYSELLWKEFKLNDEDDLFNSNDTILKEKDELTKKKVILHELVSYLESFLNLYGVMSLEVDYYKIINDQINNFQEYFPEFEDCQKVLTKIKKAD